MKVLFLGDPADVKASYVPRIERLLEIEKGSLSYEVATHLEAAESALGQGEITHVVMFHLYHPRTNNPIDRDKDGLQVRGSATQIVRESGLPSVLFTCDPKLKDKAPGRAVVLPKRSKRGVEIMPANAGDIPEEQAQEIVNLLKGKYR